MTARTPTKADIGKEIDVRGRVYTHNDRCVRTSRWSKRIFVGYFNWKGTKHFATLTGDNANGYVRLFKEAKIND